MKKFKAVFVLAATAFLAACSVSKGINKEDAVKKAQDYAAHVKEDSFKIPTKLSMKTTVETTEEVGDKKEPGSMTVEAEVDTEGKKLYSGIDLGEMKMYSWLWSDAGKYYYAMSGSLTDFSEGMYFELDAATFNAQFTEYNEYISKEAIADTLEGLASTIERMELPKNSAEDDEEQLVYSFDSSNSSESFLTSGDGNLDVDYTLKAKGAVSGTDEDGAEISGAFEVDMTYSCSIDKYLPIKESIDSKTVSPSSKGQVTMTIKTATTYKWGECKFSAPDLTKFPSPTGE